MCNAIFFHIFFKAFRIEDVLGTFISFCDMIFALFSRNVGFYIPIKVARFQSEACSDAFLMETQNKKSLHSIV